MRLHAIQCNWNSEPKHQQQQKTLTKNHIYNNNEIQFGEQTKQAKRRGMRLRKRHVHFEYVCICLPTYERMRTNKL